ncbi:hypothetical protein G1H10_06955 [Phytoactinopolyspora halotolerans]|uniref:Beta-galactosidase trimerisation domain-containing protein n=2 Tax=Phytoactinopolyspora halotolerans TaxID=1981512 RepID=A0A6L9S3B5_9ACTN|nr:hypothetical protein [Phytoactinopolyspora halotolerans]
MFQTNLREIDAGLDVETVLDTVEAHGADTWLLNAGGILSFYPTDLGFQTRNPYLAQRPSGDLVGDAVAAAHARGVRLLARMDFSKVTQRIAAEHPEWCFTSATGHLQHYNGLVSVCPSGEYYQSRTFEILDEVIDRYPVDGFFFNWFGFNEVDYSRTYHGPCHCSSCARAFAQFGAGAALPTGPDAASYDLWRRFVAETIDTLTGRIREHIAGRRPDAGLILGQSADIMFHEANNAIGRQLWPHATAEAVSAFRSHRPEVPVLVNAVAFIDMPYRMAGEEPDHFAQYLVQAISRGANPSTYIMGVPGDIPYPCLDIAGEITRFHRRWDEIYADLTPAARTALVQPDRQHQDPDRYAEATAEYHGLYSALQERHLPFDVIARRHIDDIAGSGGLDRYALLILPDLGSLPVDTVATLDAFVERGGAVLCTGSSAITDDAVQLGCLPATRREAVHAGPERLFGVYVAPEPAQAGPEPTQAGPDESLPTPAGHRAPDDGIPAAYAAPVLPVHGAYHYLAWDDDARTRLTLLGQAPYGPPEKCHGHPSLPHPGYALANHGRGRAAVVPWTIGRTYRDLGLTTVRDTVVDLAGELLDGSDDAQADLPEHVEMVVHRSAGRLVVHLINLSGVRRNTVGPPIPVDGGRLRVKATEPGATAHALVADRPCTVNPVDLADGGSGAGDELVVDIPAFGLFEVIVLSGPDQER